MGTPWSRQVVSFAIACGLSLAACGADDSSEVFAGLDVRCDKDRSSDEAMTIVEQVAGLDTDDYTVRFARSTVLGVVALVDGNTARAFQELRDDYGVVIVTDLDEGRDPVTISGPAQISEIVADRCD